MLVSNQISKFWKVFDFLWMKFSRQFVCASKPVQWMPGHEDLDQIFSRQAALIARHTFDTPQELVEILDSATRPLEGEQERVREQQGAARMSCIAYKLDRAPDWKKWASVLGIRLKGLRALGMIS